MPTLNIKEGEPITRERLKTESVEILKDANVVLKLERYIARADGKDGSAAYFSTHWQTIIDPRTGLSHVRVAYRTAEHNYVGPKQDEPQELPENDPKCLIIPNKQVGLEAFLDESQFERLLTPAVEFVRVETPFCDYCVDIVAHIEQGRNAAVLSHLNISPIIGQFATATAVGLTGIPNIQAEVTAIYERLLSKYPHPAMR